MSNSFTAYNKLTQPRNNAITTLSVALDMSVPTQSSPIYAQFPLSDVNKFYNHDYIGEQNVPTSGAAHGYITIDTQLMWFDSITAIGSNRRFKITKRRINNAVAIHATGSYIQQRITAQHFMQLQAFVSSISARFSSSGQNNDIDVSNSRYGYQYVGSKYDIGSTMWEAVTGYINDVRSGNINLPGSANWDSTYITVNSNSAAWGHGGGSQGQPLSSYSAGWQNTNTISASTRGWSNTQSVVSSNSRNWQSSYNTILSNSATWGTASPRIRGSVWVTDVIPSTTGMISLKTYESNGIVLTSCQSDTNNIKVVMLIAQGSLYFQPTVTVNGNVATISRSSDQPMWSGTANVSLTSSSTIITTSHNQGATGDICTVSLLAPPVIQSRQFLGSYPIGQTQLKSGDTFSLGVTADRPITKVVLSNVSACTSSTRTFSASRTPVITVTIANRGNSPQSLNATLSVLDSNNSQSITANTSNTVVLNNLSPSLTISSISYPAGQSALKDSQSSTAYLTVSGYTSVTATAIGSDVSIDSYDATNIISHRIGGSYNIGTSNLSITAYRSTNGTNAIATTTVKIANTVPTIIVTPQYSRLRSTPSGTAHTITLASSQQLYSTPTLQPTIGAWAGSFSGGPTSYTRGLTIRDATTKGTGSWTGLTRVNLAGKIVTSIADTYIIGGFSFRILTVPSWPNRQVSIGTQVSNTAKLLCTNLSKGDSGSLNCSFTGRVGNKVDYYTITQPTGVYSATGNLWYNSDLANAVSNSSGTMQVELQEIV